MPDKGNADVIKSVIEALKEPITEMVTTQIGAVLTSEEGIKSLVENEIFKQGMKSTLGEGFFSEIDEKIKTQFTDYTKELAGMLNKNDENRRKQIAREIGKLGETLNEKFTTSNGNNDPQQQQTAMLQQILTALKNPQGNNQGLTTSEDGQGEGDENNPFNKASFYKQGDGKQVNLEEAKKQWQTEMENQRVVRQAKAQMALLKIEGVTPSQVELASARLADSKDFDKDLASVTETIKTEIKKSKPPTGSPSVIGTESGQGVEGNDPPMIQYTDDNGQIQNMSRDAINSRIEQLRRTDSAESNSEADKLVSLLGSAEPF